MKNIITKNRFTHWYDLSGNAKHTVAGQNGNEIKTTVVHARKLGLLPSVTSILSILKKEALEDWKQEQLLKACVTLTRAYGESEHDYVNRVVDHAFSKSETSKDFGTEVHYFIQDVLEGKMRAEYAIPEKTQIAIKAVLEKEIKFAACEKSLVCLDFGYAGKRDCKSIGHDEETTTWDFKTQGTKAGEKIKTYDEWVMQIAAYDFIEPSDKYKSLVVSSTEPERVEIVEYTKDDIGKAFKAFIGLVQTFKYIKGL